MKGPTCANWCFCNHFFCGAVLLFLAGTLLSDVTDLFAGFADSVTASASPLTLLAAAASAVGLWLGYRHHGSAQPLFVALFGFFWVVVGHLIAPAFAFVGGVIVFGAAVWGALLYRTQR